MVQRWFRFHRHFDTDATYKTPTLHEWELFFTERSWTVYLWTVWWWPCSAAVPSRWAAAREAGTRGDWPGALRWSWGSRGRTAAPPRLADSLHRWSPPAGRETAEEASHSGEAGGRIWGQKEGWEERYNVSYYWLCLFIQWWDLSFSIQ